MWFEKIAGLVAGQIALSVLLAVALWRLWARLRREQHVAFWALSWAIIAVYICSLALCAMASESRSAASSWLLQVPLLGVSLGWIQPALLVLAAWSLRSGPLSRRQVILTCGIAISVGLGWSSIVWLRGEWPAADFFQRVRILVAPRTFLEAAATACYAAFFRRYYRRARSFSGWLTVGFALAWSMHLFLVALSDAGIHVYGDPNGLLNSTIAGLLPMGITLGIIFSVLEQAERSDGAIRSIWGSSVAMRLTDAQGYVVSVNRAFCDLMGRSEEQMVGRLFTECYQPSTAGLALERYRERFASPTVEPHVHRTFVRWDGKLVEAELTHAFMETPEGPRMLALMQDTTREHAALQALQHTEQRVQLLLDSITDAVFVLRTDGTSVERYTQLREMLGYPIGELPDTVDTFLALLHPGDRASLPANLPDDLPASGHLAHWEYRLRHADGRWVWIRSAVKVIERDPAGRAVRVVVTMNDISEYKAAEAEARRLESELKQTRKMEAIGRLAGGVAHDFNNHLTVINGYCDLLLHQTSDSVLKEKVAKIRTAGGRAAALTQQLLAVSRRQAVCPQRVHLNLLVEELGSLLQCVIGEHIEIVTSLDGGLGWVDADPGQMHQVLMNLTLNARDAMPDGGRILVETANHLVEAGSANRPRDARPGAYARLSVSDTGHGMSADTLERIFEPFFTTKRPGAGTGLGLSTVYGIVQQAGGWLEVESQPGKGSAFRVYLPIVEPATGMETAEDSAAETGAGTETVLVVEDQADLRHVTAEALRGKSYHVLEAGGGHEALSVCASHPGPIHLLFTDVVMPGMGGPELARLVRERRPATLVLFTSGYPAGSRQMALVESAAMLAKPFSPVELCAKVREVLDGRPASRATLMAGERQPPSPQA